MIQRPDWDSYFMQMAIVASSRAACSRRQVGAVIVRERNILATGYSGPPKGVPHYDTAGCLRTELNVPSGERHELCRGLHAEQNAIIQAAYHGVSIKGATIYCTNQPCSICTKMLINAGIREIVYLLPYNDPLASELLSYTSIKVRQLIDFEPPKSMLFESFVKELETYKKTKR